MKSAYLLYHIFLSLSSVFSKYFLFCFLTRFRSERCNFYIISYSAEFVKCFLKISFEIFRSHFSFYSRVFLASLLLKIRSIFPSPFRDSLNIISYIVRFVKRFFRKSFSAFLLRFFRILWKPSGSLNPFLPLLYSPFSCFFRFSRVSLFIIRYSLAFVNTFR